jgi:hypothetical protein
MDRRILIIPVLTILFIAILFLRPEISGFIVGSISPEQRIIEAKVVVTINEDGFIPENAIVKVYLDNRTATMSFSEFVKKAKGGHDIRMGRVEEINYEGYGYGGAYTYTLDLSQFSLDTLVQPGEHTLVTEVLYEDFVLSRTSQTINL